MTCAPDQQRPTWVDSLLDLAAQEATGRLFIVHPLGHRSWVWLRDGALTGVSAPMRRPILAHRMVAFEVATESQVTKALESVRAEPGGRLLDAVSAEGLVTHDFVNNYLIKSMAEQMSALLDFGVTDVIFEPGLTQRARPYLLSAHEIVELARSCPHELPPQLADARLRAIALTFADSLPIDRAFLALCDGHHLPDQVGDQCGLTTAEAMTMVARLLERQVLESLSESGDQQLVDDEQWNELAADTAKPVIQLPQEPSNDISPSVQGDPTERKPPVHQPLAAQFADSPPPTQPAVLLPPPIMVSVPQPAVPKPATESETAVPSQRSASSDRRDAMSLLAMFDTSQLAVVPDLAHETSTDSSGRNGHTKHTAALPADTDSYPGNQGSTLKWPTDVVKPGNAMASGDVFRELGGLLTQSDEDSDSEAHSRLQGSFSPGVPTASGPAPEEKEKKRRFLSR